MQVGKCLLFAVKALAVRRIKNMQNFRRLVLFFPILFLLIPCGCWGNGQQLNQFLASNDFEYLVELDIKDFSYEVDAKYSFVLQIIGAKKDHALSKAFKDDLSKSARIVESVYKDWIKEIERLSEISKEESRLKILKFVLLEDEDESPVLNKQGYLIVIDGRINEIIWDDGIVFFDGIFGRSRRESERATGVVQAESTDENPRGGRGADAKSKD